MASRRPVRDRQHSEPAPRRSSSLTKPALDRLPRRSSGVARDVDLSRHHLQSGRPRGHDPPDRAHGGRAASSVPVPLPPTQDLEKLIAQTVQEIASLEEKALCLDEREEPTGTDVPIAVLTSLDVPAPRKIVRVRRPGQGRRPGAETDPLEATRAFLYRKCKPQPKQMQPLWLSFDCSVGLGDPLKGSLDSLSHDPLEMHVKSLCQPW
mmetsp:Transcript_28876/g.76186  ORF Transcript_28876/g.76186 Transcript_28876/m.76186 type:complete len:208 (-) Transcript_28876:191-814(-)|eukprot:CAMPEP_0194516360 /NCGR_PEP_ID=MMETSP0253-20130528/49249_1 /TAXON_ID=2966 /ORGANISM="Noctiluca scintillans" /LENGTH=207 /DNA_ID=CAMNT_0039360209 /DNA_START=42 /DNA_END=665 /DNA_ORIENTATION=-